MKEGLYLSEGFTQGVSILDLQQKYVTRTYPTRYTWLFRERYPKGTALIVHYGHGMRHRNGRRSSHYYPDFGLNVRGTAYLHGCYVFW